MCMICLTFNTYRILQIVQGGKVSQFLRIDWLSRNFSSEIACAIDLAAMQDYLPTTNVSSELKFSSATTKLFHLERFAIYGKSTNEQ